MITGSSERPLAGGGAADSASLIEALTGSGVFMGFLEIRVHWRSARTGGVRVWAGSPVSGAGG
ncbi:hypothetical protein, partial [Nocardia barduliensis]|uniref:hypothetical protein n=1 Tax=Nocardia barduliensis TaxID=2736643 RepID=UPI001FEC682C